MSKGKQMTCPCGSTYDYLACCGKFIEAGELPDTPSQLMRSRYTAYSKGYIDYIVNTMQGSALNNFDKNRAKQWALSVQWLGLRIIQTKQVSHQLGMVEFVATYQENGYKKFIHENSEFHRVDGRWYYVNGQTVMPSRNNACPCGSGKKYKKCCL